MKVRNGFVSNSSSSSFVLQMDKITAKQMYYIDNHLDYAKLKGWNEYDHDQWDKWSITSDGEVVKGRTDMNNFDMRHFLEKIGVPEDAYEFGDY